VISSIDTYLYKEIESKMKIILSNRYIIEEILKGVQKDIAESFMKAYVGDSPLREVPISYTMPQTKESLFGSIFISLREGAETQPSIGNMEATYTYREGGMLKEKSTVKAEEGNKRLYLEVSSPIGEFINVEGLMFADSDHKTIEENRIYFRYDAELLGYEFTVVYEADRGEEAGIKKGFTAEEHYSVLAVSTNMDTVRCLDLIMKAILILMRDNQEEHTNFLLQKLQFGQVEPINVGADPEETPELLYGKETIVTYTTSYSLDAPILDTILKEIKVKVHEKLNE
jgi:hypothetical protein